MDLTRIGRARYARPGLTFFQNQLAVAWVDRGPWLCSPPRLQLALGAMPATGQLVSNLSSPGTAVARDISLAVFRDRLYIGFIGVDLHPHLISSADGATFDAQLDLPDDVSSGISLATDGVDQLYMAWAQSNSNQLTVCSTGDGHNINERQLLTPTSIVTPELVLTPHPYSGQQLGILWRGADLQLRIAMAPLSYLPALNGDRPPLPVGSEVSPSAWAYRPATGQETRISIAYIDPPSHLLGLTTTDVDGSAASLSKRETRTLDVHCAPCLTDVQGTLVMAYVSGDHSVYVGDHDSVFEFGTDLQDQIGKICDPRVCTDDPRLVCVVSGETKLEWQPAQISNADRGYLVLTPADGTGVIGTLLKDLRPQQYFDHMGIMVQKATVIRHCTEQKNRLMKKEEYYTGSVLGSPVPTNGLRPDHVKYGWPGPITQTVQNGFFDGWSDGANPNWTFAAVNKPGASMNPAQAEAQARGFLDPERPGDAYQITNLTVAPAYPAYATSGIYPQVVRPPRDIEAQFPWVGWLVNRIADEAVAIDRAHYRFYAYSQAAIVDDAAMWAPRHGDPYWWTLPPGADWAADTPGLVCSTFIWAAARNAIRGLVPGLRMEYGPFTHGEDLRASAPKPIDGLYQYLEPERLVSAQNLYDWIVNDVRVVVKQKVDDLYPNSRRYGLAALMLLMVSGPAALLVLGITSADMESLTELLTKMPEHVANGICNAFALDQPENVSSDTWRRPGVGMSVAPDDIMSFWDAPPGPDPTLRVGPYGAIERALFAGPRTDEVAVGRLARSAGVAQVSGRIQFRGEPLTGASLSIGCRSTKSGPQAGAFTIYVPAAPSGGLQLIRAGCYWEDAQKVPWWLRKELQLALGSGYNDIGIIELEMPPAWRRQIEIHGTVHMKHQVMFGHDTISDIAISDVKYLQWRPDWQARPDYTGTDESKTSFGRDSDVCGGETAKLTGAVELQSDLSIKVGWSLNIWDGDTLVQVADGAFSVPPDAAPGTASYQIDDGDIPPDRASFDLTITNNTAPA